MSPRRCHVESLHGHQRLPDRLSQVQRRAAPKTGMDLLDRLLRGNLCRRPHLLLYQHREQWQNLRERNAVVLDCAQMGWPSCGDVLWSGVVGAWEARIRVATKLTSPDRVCIVTIFTIYFLAGRRILMKKRQLGSSPSTDSVPLENPFTSHGTTEILVTREVNMETNSVAELARQRDVDPTRELASPVFEQYNVTVGRGEVKQWPQQDAAQKPKFQTMEAQYRDVTAEAEAAASGYLKCASLFFVSLLITWVSRSLSDRDISGSRQSLPLRELTDSDRRVIWFLWLTMVTGSLVHLPCLLPRSSRLCLMAARLSCGSRLTSDGVLELGHLRRHLLGCRHESLHTIESSQMVESHEWHRHSAAENYQFGPL